MELILIGAVLALIILVVDTRQKMASLEKRIDSDRLKRNQSKKE